MTAGTHPLWVCEKSGFWAAAFRWQHADRPLPLREFRSLIDVRAAIRSGTAQVVALETVAANAEGVLGLLLEARRHWPAPRIIVLLAPDVRDLASLFWEAGAAWVVLSPRRLQHVARWIEHYLAAEEPPELTTRERIWSRLPWRSESS